MVVLGSPIVRKPECAIRDAAQHPAIRAGGGQRDTAQLAGRERDAASQSTGGAAQLGSCGHRPVYWYPASPAFTYPSAGRPAGADGRPRP